MTRTSTRSGSTPQTMPIVFQYNKRDLPEVLARRGALARAQPPRRARARGGGDSAATVSSRRSARLMASTMAELIDEVPEPGAAGPARRTALDLGRHPAGVRPHDARRSRTAAAATAATRTCGASRSPCRRCRGERRARTSTRRSSARTSRRRCALATRSTRCARSATRRAAGCASWSLTRPGDRGAERREASRRDAEGGARPPRRRRRLLARQPDRRRGPTRSCGCSRRSA